LEQVFNDNIGPSGLVAIKEALASGLVPVCFEASSSIGGLWKYNTKQGIYQSTVMNTSKEMIQFSDFEIPKDFPQFLPHYLVQDYLEMYCDHFCLREHIKFNRKIVSVRQEIVDGKETGRWEVIYKSKERSRKAPKPSPMNDLLQVPDDANRGASIDSGYEITQEESTLKHKSSLEFRFSRSSEDGPFQETPVPPVAKKTTFKKDVFEFVIIATGHHWKPRIPHFEGMHDFQGTVIHSYQYKVYDILI
jgi:cation diffusion facilitator CzcD-associated flavoprotein CzcO